MSNEKDCRHDNGFVCLATHSSSLPSVVWGCRCRCGFYLNFDPVNYVGSVALLVGPSPEVDWKNGPKINWNIGP